MRFALTVFVIVLVALVPETKPAPLLSFQAGFFERAETATTSAPYTSTYTEAVFLGDLLLARRIETLMDRYGSDYVYRRLPAFSTTTSYVVANFESAVPNNHRHTPDLTFSFSTDTVHLQALRDFGVTQVSLANNHSYDSGIAGYQETIDNLSQANLNPFGDQQVGSSTLDVVTINGQSLIVAALYAIDVEPDYAVLKRELAQFGTSTPAVAYIHWGSEYTLVHTPNQARIAEELIALGFDAIIGHHPHVVQDIALIDGVPVFYSLGNFIFDQYFSVPVQQGMILRLRPGTDVWEFQLQPVTALDVQSQPRLMQANEQAAFFADLAAKSSPELRLGIEAGLISIPN